ncbi:hypothetical protein Cni_G16363 [Canna indica]|uniref:YqgE/AlgH family protein n=1 Tax=Canna indica TaxID=4628 RepID=A0AAQ3QFT5_9LILI|nr:hypothetical protein Cni_G16363 [Canna indica]
MKATRKCAQCVAQVHDKGSTLDFRQSERPAPDVRLFKQSIQWRSSGEPLEASMFLVRRGDSSPLPRFGEVVLGVCFGARNNLNEVAPLVKKGVLRPLNFRFFVGYAGWQFDQLLDEIDSGYWVVVACSSHLINEATANRSSSLWKEILLLMGGKYPDLNRKPKRDP